MAEGIIAAGDQPVVMTERYYKPKQVLEFDCAVFYGLEGNTPQLFKDYAAHSAAVYVDLGYWGRREGGRWTGYHKISVNSRHPNAYFRAIAHPADRLARFKLTPKAWRTPSSSAHILLAGMGDKGARAEGYDPNQWEREAVEVLRQHTTRPILYRPKPSWKTAKPIAGTNYSAPHARELELDLRGCWAVVTHHSNVAVDALVEGIPSFCWAGVAREMSSQDLAQIETPFYPSDREQWLADIAYTQWSIAEMRSGAAWRHLKKENLVP
jgi:hypothetical protein